MRLLGLLMMVQLLRLLEVRLLLILRLPCRLPSSILS
jgi:hypothetical protein